MMANMSQEKLQWTFFSNYTHVLVCIAEDPEIRTRDIAIRVGITERTAVRIIQQLREEGILIANRNGRRNHYLVNVDYRLRHPLESHRTVGEILSVIIDEQTIRKLRKRHRDGSLELSQTA